MTAPDAMVHRARQKVLTIRPIARRLPLKRARRSIFEPRRPSKQPRGPRWDGLLPRLLEGIDHIARLVFGRRNDRQGIGVLELVDTITLDAAELCLENPRFRPFAVFAERYVADDGFECGLAQVISELGVLDAFGRRYRLSEYIEIRITERGHVVAEGIDPCLGGT